MTTDTLKLAPPENHGTSLGEFVFERLRGAIRDRRYQPGQRIREAEVAPWLGGSRTPVLRELASLRVAQRTGAEDEWAHHMPSARSAGVSKEQIAVLERWEKAPEFDDQQRAVLAYVEAATTDVMVPDDVFEAAREHLSDGEIVELTLVCGYWGMVARVLVAAQVDVEPEYIKYLPSTT